MKLRKIQFVEVEYIDSGTFQGGEEDCYDLRYDETDGFEFQDYIVIRKEDFEYLTQQLKQKYDRRNIEN
jgi:hypothetical protein